MVSFGTIGSKDFPVVEMGVACTRLVERTLREERVPREEGVPIKEERVPREEKSLPVDPLVNATYENTEVFTPFFNQAKVVKVYDGDTLHVVAILFDRPYRFMVRMYGYDSPELRSKNPVEKEAAQAARKALSDRILYRMVQINIRPEKDKYGRLLARIADCDGSINDWMIAQGHGKPYFGGTKEKMPLEDP